MTESIDIDKRYFLAETIKEGGFGIVHKGFDLKFDMIVAVKEIHPMLLSDKKVVDMFQDEAVMTAKLRHANIVTVIDFRKTEDNRFYIIMEYVEGIDLRTLLERCESMGQCFPFDLGIYIIGEVCKALDYAHNKKDSVSGESLNIIHRDISPSNIMATVDGTVKVIDFGIAKARYRRAEETRTGFSLGKLSYMSPQQVDCKPIDHRSDLFSLGTVMFEVITGKRLFETQTERSLMNMVAEARVDLSLFDKFQIPQELRKIILKAVQKMPEDRYQSGREMNQDIYNYLQQISKRELSSALSEFVREHYYELQKGRKEITKDQIKIDEGTKHIKTISISPDLDKEKEREEPTRKDLYVEPPTPLKRKPEPILEDISRPKFRIKEYSKEIKIAANLIMAGCLLFLILDIARGITNFGKTIHYRLFPLAWRINTVPSGATVVIGGTTLLGKTPLVFKSKPGDYPISLYRAGFSPIINDTLHILSTKKMERYSEYSFKMLLEFNSDARVDKMIFNGNERLEIPPCKIPWEISTPVRIRLLDKKGHEIDGFTFQGMETDPEVTDSASWKYEIVPDSICTLKITGNFKHNFRGHPFSPKVIQAIHLKQAIELKKLKEKDHLVLVAVSKDSSFWNHLSWYYRRNLPDTVYFQEANLTGDYRVFYFGPIKGELSANNIIQQLRLNELKIGIKFLVVENLNLIEAMPVMTIEEIFPIEL